MQAVENDHDATTAASLEAVERRGEMVIRLLDLRTMGKLAAEAAKRFLSIDPSYLVQFVEIVKRPGQTLGLYIREGNGLDRLDGVFVSRIALESAVYNSGCLRVGDEILAVNFVDVTSMSLDDVVIIMSIPRRLVLTIRSRKHTKGVPSPTMKQAEQKGPPVVVFKKELEEEALEESNSNGENGLMRAIAESRAAAAATYLPDDHYLYYNSQPQPKFRAPKVSPKAMERDAWIMEPGPSGYQQAVMVVSEQPRPVQAYPKTLESLAEKVHAFYAGPRPAFGDGTVTLGRPLYRHPSATSFRMLQPSRSERTLVRRGSVQGPPGGGATMTVRARRLSRAESDQRISLAAERDSYEYDSTYWARTLRSSLKPAPSMQPYVDRGGRYAHTMQRLSALRRRAAMESSSSDTEVQMVPRSAALLARHTSLDRTARFHAQGRSNSLPRMRADDHHRRHRHMVRFERDTLPHDSQEDSDGAVSAPELPVGRRDRGEFF